MRNDITFTVTPTETIIHPASPKGAAWIAKNLTTNVTDLHYDTTNGTIAVDGILTDMRSAGLEVAEQKEGDIDSEYDAMEYDERDSPKELVDMVMRSLGGQHIYAEEDTQRADEQGNRVGLGRIPCKYCGNKDCNFGCDESQAGGFNSNDNPFDPESPEGRRWESDPEWRKTVTGQ
jgi:hypothetical protein